jgi:hypothetical protein
MSGCGPTRAADGSLATDICRTDAQASGKTDKKVVLTRRVSSGPSLDNPKQHIEARPSPAHHRRVAEASTSSSTNPVDGSAKINQSKPLSVGAKIDQLKKELGIGDLKGPELEERLDKIEDIKWKLYARFSNPLDQRSINIDKYIDELKSNDAPAPIINDWKTLKQVEDLKCLILRDKISPLKTQLDTESLKGPELEKTVDEIIANSKELTGANFVSQWDKLPKKIDKYIEQLKSVGTDPDVISDWVTLKQAIDIKCHILKDRQNTYTKEAADAHAYAKKLTGRLITSNLNTEQQARYAKELARTLRSYSIQMTLLHGDNSQDSKCNIELNANQRLTLSKIIGNLSNNNTVSQEDFALITAATNPPPKSVVVSRAFDPYAGPE